MLYCWCWRKAPIMNNNYQVRFTTATKTYHCDFDAYDKAKEEAKNLLFLGCYMGETIEHIGIINQTRGIELLK